MKLRKNNIKISFKISDVGQGLDLKDGEIGTDGQNIFLGRPGGSFAITLPVGSIVFWMPVGFAGDNNESPTSLINNISIPPGWEPADGSKVEEDGSVYTGKYLPNLTNDIFLQGSVLADIGLTGGTNDPNHKHNIAHHHVLASLGLNAGGNHSHGYLDRYAFDSQAIEEGGGRSTNWGNTDPQKYSNYSGVHTHNINSMPVGDIASGLEVNSTNHLNLGNARKTDDSADFTENRPNYITGIFLIRIR